MKYSKNGNENNLYYKTLYLKSNLFQYITSYLKTDQAY
jgi:hypothetical protein